MSCLQLVNNFKCHNILVEIKVNNLDNFRNKWTEYSYCFITHYDKYQDIKGNKYKSIIVRIHQIFPSDSFDSEQIINF